MKFLRQPYFISESQYDSFQLYWDLGGKQPPYSGEAAAYSEEFRLQMRNALIAASSSGLAGVFASACFKHCLSLSADFWESTLYSETDGVVSLRDSLTEWMSELSLLYGTSVMAMDNCVDFNCGCQVAAANKWGSVL